MGKTTSPAILKLKRTSSLSSDIQNLVKKAIQQTKVAYAPYSNFKVGAAILLENGKIILGCNQENASYPLCMCAERVALYNYGSKKRKHKILSIAITAENKANPLTEPCMPCGACRQVLLEFEQRQSHPIQLIATANNLKDALISDSVAALLPSAFDKAAL